MKFHAAAELLEGRAPGVKTS